MFIIDTSDLRKIGSVIEESLREASRIASGEEGAVGRIVSAGVRRHFRILEFGGNDPMALGMPVTWARHRHQLTKKVRLAVAGKTYASFPLLSVGPSPGSIEKAYTMPRAVTTSAMRKDGSLMFYQSVDPAAVMKGSKNQFGGIAIARFFNRDYAVDFPPRPFLYWDWHMVGQTVSLTRKKFEEAIKKRKAP